MDNANAGIKAKNHPRRQYMLGRILLIVFLVAGLLVASSRNWKGFLVIAALFLLTVVALLYQRLGLFAVPGEKSEIPKEIISISLVHPQILKPFITDREVTNLLKEKYHIVVSANTGRYLVKKNEQKKSTGRKKEIHDYFPASSLEEESLERKMQEADCIFGVSIDLGEPEPGFQGKGEFFYQTPVVFYLWREAETAVKMGNVVGEKGSDKMDIKAFFSLCREKQPWQRLGLKQEGHVRFFYPDTDSTPAGKALSLLISGMEISKDPEGSCFGTPVPGISGYTLFGRFVKQGFWSYPVICGTKNLFSEYKDKNPSDALKLEKEINISYPVPGALIRFPLLIHSQKGEKLAQALSDPKLAEIARTRFGFDVFPIKGAMQQ